MTIRKRRSLWKKENMVLEKNALIEELKMITESLIGRAEDYKRLTTEELNSRPEPDKWTILECLEHLNRYGEFYLPEIEKRLLDHQAGKEVQYFRPGWLGNYFAGMMLVKDGRMKKMKTFQDKDPIYAELSTSTLDRFIKQQKHMLRLLDLARNKDLSRIKTNISISKWIKMRLGDTFRFVIYHNQRHIFQADKIADRIGV